MKFKDYYKTLGVERNSSADEIQKSFRKLARKFHPDVNKEVGAEDRFKEINEAYEVLGDAEKRKKYDMVGSDFASGQDFRPPPGWEQRARPGHGGQGAAFEFEGFSDFFGALFGQQAGAGGQTFRSEQSPFGNFGSSPRAEPPTEEAEVEVEISEAILGASRSLSLRSAQGQKTLRVKIPKLVVPDSRIRLTGQGSGGSDLFLRIKVVDGDDQRVQGSDLVTTVPISPWEAALGEKIDVKLPDGTVKVSVPPGVQSGAKLRVRDRGLGESGGTRGDALVELVIAMPKTISEKEKELFQELKTLSQFNPRSL